MNEQSTWADAAANKPAADAADTPGDGVQGMSREGSGEDAVEVPEAGVPAVPAAESAPAAPSDDLDDFGDFAEGDENTAGELEPEPVSDSLPAQATDARSCVRVSGRAADMADEIRALLPADFYDACAPANEYAENNVVGEGLRQVEGISQVLFTERSRRLYHELHAVPALGAPLDWRRSYTRRQQLIALGVPINLDEVHSDTWSHREALPPLELHVEQPAPRLGAPGTRGDEASARGAPEGWGERRRCELGLAEPPHVSMERIDAVLKLSEDDLTLQTLPELRELVRELKSLSSQLGEALQYYLTVRDAFLSDAEMYNGMIRDLVAGASNKIAATRKAEKRGLIGRGARRSGSAPNSRPGTPGSERT